MIFDECSIRGWSRISLVGWGEGLPRREGWGGWTFRLFSRKAARQWKQSGQKVHGFLSDFFDFNLKILDKTLRWYHLERIAAPWNILGAPLSLWHPPIVIDQDLESSLQRYSHSKGKAVPRLLTGAIYCLWNEKMSYKLRPPKTVPAGSRKSLSSVNSTLKVNSWILWDDLKNKNEDPLQPR